MVLTWSLRPIANDRIFVSKYKLWKNKRKEQRIPRYLENDDELLKKTDGRE